MNDKDIASERKNLIVSATIDCIAKHGYYNFSMQDVAKTASVSKGIIHYYFLNKNDLMLSVLERVSQDMGNAIIAKLAVTESAADKLAIFVEANLELVRSHPELFQVFLDFLPQIEIKKQARQHLYHYYENVRVSCQAILEEGVKQKLFTPMNPKDHSYYIMSMIDGLSLRWILAPDRFDFDNLSKQMIHVILAGLKP